MSLPSSVRRRLHARRWLGIELGAVATIVSMAWLDEPTSFERFALMCACWVPFLCGAARRVSERWRTHA